MYIHVHVWDAINTMYAACICDIIENTDLKSTYQCSDERSHSGANTSETRSKPKDTASQLQGMDE